MTYILKYLNGLSPFVQGVFGSAVFAMALLAGRLLLSGTRQGGKKLFKFMSRSILLKHVLHKKYVHSDNLHLMIWGNFFVISTALQWSIKAGAILVFVFAVSSIVERQWLHLIGYYLAFNAFYEADSWLKDWSDEKHISYIDPEVKSELLKKFIPNETVSMQTTNDSSDTAR